MSNEVTITDGGGNVTISGDDGNSVTISSSTNSVTIQGNASSVPDWGEIGGTLSDQTDLQNALDLLVPYTGATETVNLGSQDLTTTGDVTANAFIGDGSQLTGIASVTIGTDNQIPFVNADGDDFDYSANLTFDGTTLGITGDVSVSNDILLGSGSVLNWNSGDVTLTHSSNALTLSGGALQVDTIRAESPINYADILFTPYISLNENTFSSATDGKNIFMMAGSVDEETDEPGGVTILAGYNTDQGFLGKLWLNAWGDTTIYGKVETGYLYPKELYLGLESESPATIFTNAVGTTTYWQMNGDDLYFDSSSGGGDIILGADNQKLCLGAGIGGDVCTYYDANDWIFDVQNNGLFTIDNGQLRIIDSSTPASASATGKAGQIAWDSSYIYICTDTDTWKRVAISTW